MHACTRTMQNPVSNFKHIGNSQQLVRKNMWFHAKKKLPDKSINAPIVFILIYDKVNTYLQYICYYQIERGDCQNIFI